MLPKLWEESLSSFEEKVDYHYQVPLDFDLRLLNRTPDYSFTEIYYDTFDHYLSQRSCFLFRRNGELVLKMKVSEDGSTWKETRGEGVVNFFKKVGTPLYYFGPETFSVLSKRFVMNDQYSVEVFGSVNRGEGFAGINIISTKPLDMPVTSSGMIVVAAKFGMFDLKVPYEVSFSYKELNNILRIITLAELYEFKEGSEESSESDCPLEVGPSVQSLEE